jgi:hypothetical protein
MRIGISRGIAAAALCIGTALSAPTAAIAALSTHSATASTPNSAGQLVATAKCGLGQHVVSGGFKSLTYASAVASHAVHGDSWTVRLFPGPAKTLTTYAYCASKGNVSQHETQVNAKHAPLNTTATAHCSAGQTLVSGGYVFIGSQSQLSNSPTFRDYASGGKAWKVMAAFAFTPAKLAAFAYCERGVNVKVRSASSHLIHHGGNRSATASCRKGETLLSGGYTTTPMPDWFNVHGPDFFYYASYRSGSRSWTASAYNYSSIAGHVTAFAYCQG